MARAHLFRALTDNQGNLLFNATVTLYQADFAVPLNQPIWPDEKTVNASLALPNPFTVANGIIDVWLDNPQRVTIAAQASGVEDIVISADVNPSANQIVYGSQPLMISNQPTAVGDVLLSTGTSGVASWGAAPSGTGLTPIISVVNVNFATAGDPLGWSFSGSAVASRSYDPHNVPPNTSYIYSLLFPSPVSTVQTQNFTFLEAGSVSFWAKTMLSSGQTVTITLLDLSSNATVLQTITDTRTWGFYSYPVAAGTWSIKISYAGTAGSPNSFWMTGFQAQYGGNVPAHNHTGVGTNSVALGVSASAPTSGATAIGANSTANGSNSSAIGYTAQATGTTSLAIGTGAVANSNYAIAIGAAAVGSNTASAWISIGNAASATGLESVAVGKSASASADETVAIGSGSVASGIGAVAIGQNAQAKATDSFALGLNTLVGSTHTNSVALGAGAATTSANQVMLGSTNHITTVAGNLTTQGSVALGTASSRVGFYGSAGTTKPVVNGSDNGNVVVRSLVQSLAAMGLITNNTVQQPAAFNAPVGNIDYFLRADNGLGNLGVADFDFQPYSYAPLAFGGTSPFPATPQWSIGSTHFASKGSIIGPSPIKNAYAVNASYSLQMQVVTPGSLASGDRFVLVLRHTGATDGSAACAYLVFDYSSTTVELGVNNGSGNPTSFTVASGNNVALSPNVFDGNLHTLTVFTGTSTVGLQIDNAAPIFFRDGSMNLTGTYIGWDTNVSSLGNIVFTALLYNPPAIFDSFHTNTATLTQTETGQSWNMIAGTGSSSLSAGSGVLTLTSTSGTGNHIGVYVTSVLNTMGKTINTSFTSIPGSGTAGVLAHFQDLNNYVLVTPTNVIQVLSGTQTTLGSLSTAIVANDLLTVTIAAGGAIKVFKNGTQQASVSPGLTIPQNPNMGLYAVNGAVLPVDFFMVSDQFTSTVYK